MQTHPSSELLHPEGCESNSRPFRAFREELGAAPRPLREHRLTGHLWTACGRGHRGWCRVPRDTIFQRSERRGRSGKRPPSEAPADPSQHAEPLGRVPVLGSVCPTRSPHTPHRGILSCRLSVWRTVPRRLSRDQPQGETSERFDFVDLRPLSDYGKRSECPEVSPSQ